MTGKRDGKQYKKERENRGTDKNICRKVLHILQTRPIFVDVQKQLRAFLGVLIQYFGVFYGLTPFFCPYHSTLSFSPFLFFFVVVSWFGHFRIFRGACCILVIQMYSETPATLILVEGLCDETIYHILRPKQLLKRPNNNHITINYICFGDTTDTFCD